jgi:MoxR-like ATPase
MEEKQVTVAGERRLLSRPFFVLATQNPIELEGTYPLPEAQLDRFMFNILIDYLDEDEELAVATRTVRSEEIELTPVFTGADLMDFSRLVRLVPIAEPIARYAVKLAQASRPDQPQSPEFVRNWVGWGAGTRASQNLILAAKARALLRGRVHVSIEDIRAVARPVLRHRILMNFRAEADRVGPEDLIEKLLKEVPVPQSGLS